MNREICNFKVGQKVVAKDLSRHAGLPYGIKKGGIYTVELIEKCSAGYSLRLIGADSGWPKSCTCGNPHASNSFMAWRFEPLKYDLIDNKELIKEIIEERLDIEIQQPVYHPELLTK